MLNALAGSNTKGYFLKSNHVTAWTPEYTVRKVLFSDPGFHLSQKPPVQEMTEMQEVPGQKNNPLREEIQRRRTFAIIAHPDAGKTTLTEKLLLYGGAIQLAGQVRARKDRRKTRSDWMTIEQ